MFEGMENEWVKVAFFQDGSHSTTFATVQDSPHKAQAENLDEYYKWDDYFSHFAIVPAKMVR